MPVTGKKEELIQRILQNESAQPKDDSESVEQSRVDSKDDNKEDDSKFSTSEQQPAPAVTSESQQPQQQSQSATADDATAELERKKARAERFGQSTAQFEKEQEKVSRDALDVFVAWIG